ncbi:MAG: pilus assembly protein N-terminal domain-containing protein [Deltaproteobacteria bacterium]|nr:pilus assembly protein N-terminal domain-containing protein [Deltaproteobacteria bacterium]
MIILGWSHQSFSQEKLPVKAMIETLTAGVTKTIDLDFTPGNIIVGNPSVCNFIALREQKQITLVPKKNGNTSVTIQDLEKRNRVVITITVIVSDRAKVAAELRDLLKDVEGVKIKIIGKKVLIDGEILLPAHLNRIITVANQYSKEELGVIATLSPVAQKIIADKMQEDIHKMGHKEVRVRAVNQKFLVEGTVERGPDGDENRNAVLAIETAKTYVPDIFVTQAEKEGVIEKPSGGPPVVVNLLVVKAKPAAQPEKLVRITTHYVELSKNYAKNFAFNWSPGIQDESTIELKKGNLATTVTATVSSLIPKLNKAKTHGHARVLESSTLVVQNNSTGKLENATQIPITVFSTSGGATQQGTEFQDVGLTMEILPTTLEDSTQVRLNIAFKLKAVIDFNERGQPSISLNNINTVLIVNSGESAAIGGIVSNNLASNYNRIPSSLANNENLLFNLYRSKSFQNNKSQFVIFVTPEILQTASEGAKDLKRKFRVK